VARDLAPLGYEITVFDGEAKAGGFIRSQIPRFRLPESVIDEETGYILDMGVHFRSGQRVDSLRSLLEQGYDAVFVGSGAPRGRDLDIPGRREIGDNIHIGIDWLASVSFGHMSRRLRRASSCLAVATPPWTAAARHGAWAAPTSRSSCAAALTR
jgi:formate dehydrogenase beta subunit